MAEGSSPHAEGSARTTWDARAAARAALFAVLVMAIVLAITASTDEGQVAFLVRLGRAIPAAPLCAALGVWLALRSARARGELLALASLGRSPLQIGAPAVLGGVALVVATSAAVLFVDAVDVSGFYPRATRAEDYRFDGHDFVNARRGFRVGPDGDVTRLPADALAASPRANADDATLAATATAPRGGRAAAAFALAFAGAALALLAARGDRAARDAFVDGVGVVVSVGLSIVVFHAAAVGRVAPAFATTPAALLLAWSLFRYRARPWPQTQSPTRPTP